MRAQLPAELCSPRERVGLRLGRGAVQVGDGAGSGPVLGTDRGVEEIVLDLTTWVDGQWT
jgi:hypothetical protein